ncbi:60S ribosomal protein L44 [Caligus rogercresseyi]|uniref:60S ribosomal protein L44 n=1 Tax=Caligus rogercresseyi TaxID=217165 RepID=A0A7T8HEJ9_CALRO|nr:60S ribosomal protein L44 [Caligus rogercresseyi]
MLGSLEGNLLAALALAALETKHDLLRGLGLLTQNGLGLTTETLLLTIVAPTTLGKLESWDFLY